MIYLVSITFHPTVGKEAELLKALKDKAKPGGIYHKKDSDAIVITTHQLDETATDNYIKSSFINELNTLCTSPATIEVFEILTEEVA